MRIIREKLAASLCVLLLCGAPLAASAKVSEAEAEKLGKELTPLGAEPQGSKDGTIPEWKGAAIFNDEQKHYTFAKLQQLRSADPDRLNMTRTAQGEAVDKPLFTITAQNYTQYAEHLSAGHQEMFRRYPDYKMIVYPSVRGHFAPEEINEAVKYNATHAELDGTDDISGARLATPFPIPKNGAEVMWNNRLKFRGVSAVRRYNNQAIVDADGSFQISKLIEDVRVEYGNLKDKSRENNVIVYYLQRTLSPARVAGQITLVHEIFGKGTSGRNAWIYNPGLARVNRAPEVGFDNPSLGSDGLQFNDQIDMFNGSLSRYDWKLIGKREIYIPYNAYTMSDPRYKYKDIIRKGHINQDLARYELHRVWVVEANLRPGHAHQFKRRTFYLDEDSWALTLVDCYDNRDKLWKLQEGHVITLPFLPGSTTVPEVIYDLQSGRYFVTAMVNEDSVNNFELSFDREYFLPKNLRSLGERR
ncbi:DUF1329 domain-containing protein [Solimonas variicoloris]|uniref:DUF1329 domain-containing protein n=1 Tax=Solimonas variicoloris TaxID=254408 RepID=UPI000584B089|nr:DUF1329 domain-containing protein [Solimonas variicoloris]